MEKLKIALISVNSKYIHSSLSVWYLKAGIEKYSEGDIDAEVIESTINAPVDDLFSHLSKSDFDIFAFSSYIWNIEWILQLAKRLKREKPKAKILLGGPEVSYRARDILERYSFIDFVLSGEGEKPIAELLDAIYFDKKLAEIKSLSFRISGEIIEGNPFIDSEDPPTPYTAEYLEKLNGRIAYIEASRGCPYRCAFCLSGRCGGVRYFDLERVKKDIITLYNSGAKTIKFVDRTFNSSESRANEILKFILNNIKDNSVCFHFEIAGDILRESTLELLGKFPKGAVQLEIGMQSFNEETLKAINRKTDTKKLIENIKRLKALGRQHIHIDLIAGLKGEGLESFKNSFNIGYCLKANMLQLGFLKLLYGADMREKAEEYPCSFSENPPYEVTSTPWLSEEEIKGLKRMEDALERLYNSGRFSATLDYLTDELNFDPFGLFWDFGNSLNAEKMPLMEYIDKVFEYFKSKPSVNPEILRDKLIIDRLASDSSANIPESLKIPDERLKIIKKALSKKGKKLGVAIVYSEGKVISADYSEKDSVWGRYTLKEYDLGNFLGNY